MNRLVLLAWLIAAVVCPGLTRESVIADEPAAREASKPDAAAETSEEPQYVRVRRDDNKRPAAMETSVVQFSAAARPGVTVDLVGAVHVGDKSYYERLNKLFEDYDVVLYELVAPEGTRVPKGGRPGRSTHPIGVLQDGMSTILELAHQLNCIDYTKDNFVHADMSPADFAKAMEERGESFVQLFLRLMGTGMAQSASGAGASDAALLMALFSKDRAMKLKTLMAEQFETMDGAMAALDGPGGSAIITERNKKCFEVLDKQLAAGKKKIAIFYGAGHLADMERRLVEDYDFKRSGESWLAAWDLQPAK
jgi:hypothetical protein